jgi:hypothetical protein
VLASSVGGVGRASSEDAAPPPSGAATSSEGCVSVALPWPPAHSRSQPWAPSPYPRRCPRTRRGSPGPVARALASPGAEASVDEGEGMSTAAGGTLSRAVDAREGPPTSPEVSGLAPGLGPAGPVLALGEAMHSPVRPVPPSGKPSAAHVAQMRPGLHPAATIPGRLPV